MNHRCMRFASSHNPFIYAFILSYYSSFSLFGFYFYPNLSIFGRDVHLVTVLIHVADSSPSLPSAPVVVHSRPPRECGYGSSGLSPSPDSTAALLSNPILPIGVKSQSAPPGPEVSWHKTLKVKLVVCAHAWICAVYSYARACVCCVCMQCVHVCFVCMRMSTWCVHA